MEPKKIRMFLYKPNQKTEIGEIIHASFSPHNIKFASVNDLSFTIPYEIVVRNKLERNRMVDIIREKYLIKVVSGDEEEFYTIKKKKKIMGENDALYVEAYSLQYELKQYKILDLELTSVNCLEVLTYVLKGTGWKVGYVHPDFQMEWRQFEISSSNKLDFMDEICKTFNSVVQYDTINKTISMHKEDELSIDRGFIIEYSRYLDAVEDEIDIEEVITRLHVANNGKASINAANPTGQSYIDDFSYFLYPFERDEKGNVIKSSYFLSDQLCHAILDYNQLINQYETSFSSLLETKKKLNVMKTTLGNELQILKDDFSIILDDIEAAKIRGEALSSYITSRDVKQVEIKQKEAEIMSTDAAMEDAQNVIKALNDKLKIENNFSETLLDELARFTQEEEWSDNNQINDEEYYYKASEYLKTVSIPSVNITLSIVNFLEILEEQKNWDKLNIGDLVTIRHEKLDIDVQAKITEISHNYSDGTINITVSNAKKRETLLQKFSRAAYVANKLNNDFSKIRPKILAASTNFNTRNDRIADIPTSPSHPTITHVNNDDGSVGLTLTWVYPDYEATKKDADNIDGFLVYLYAADNGERHVLGSSLEEKMPNEVSASLRSFTYASVAGNKYYTLGVQAYRRVDEDINSSGILYSDIVSNHEPYRPVKTLVMKGDFEGKVNGSLPVFSPVEPMIEQTNGVNVVWYDTTENTVKFKDSLATEFTKMNAGEATSVGGYTPEATNVPNTIPVRDVNGKILGDISGDAATFSGMTSEQFVLQYEKGVSGGVASLDENGKILSSQLNETFSTGTYIGDGTVSRVIPLTFTPRIVKIYTTSPSDTSLYINSTTRGFALKPGVNSVYLSSDMNTSPTQYGNLVEAGFATGGTQDALGNKLNVQYHWEAIK